MPRLSEFIQLSAGFKTAVNLRDDIDDLVKAAGFIPTRNAADVVFDLGKNLHPTAAQRARLVMGTYGTGKSHLALLLANLYRRKQNSLHPVFEKLRDQWPGECEQLDRQLGDIRHGFLVVLLEGYSGQFADALLQGLDRALSSDEALHGFMPQTVFSAALERLRDLEDKYADAYQRLAERVRDTRYASLEGLRARLQDYDREAYEAFREVHREACSGADFVAAQFMAPDEVFPAVVRQLQEKGLYDGIVVFWDEFGHYMETMVRNPQSAEAEQIQRFAEICNASKQAQVHLYLICHRSLQEYVAVVRQRGAAGPSDALPDDLRKVAGRFKPFNMRTSDDETFNLMDQVVIQNSQSNAWGDLTARFADQFEKWTTQACDMRLFPEFDYAKVRRVVTFGCYPLHPATAFSLPRMSERVAQNERTLFTFLADTGTGSLGEFVEATEFDDDDAGPPVVALDLLWDYFEDETREEPQTAQTFREYSQATAKVGADDEMAKRVLRVIGVVSTIASDRLPGATEDVIAYGLGIASPERQALSDCLKRLAAPDAQVLVRRSSDGAYRFYRGVGTASMEEALAETVQEQREHLDWVERLNSRFWDELGLDRRIPASGYSDDKFVTRALRIEVVGPGVLANPNDLLRRFDQDETLDCLAVLVLADGGSGTEHLADRVASFWDGDGDMAARDRLVFALPAGVVNAEQLVREIEALDYLQRTQSAIFGRGGEQEDEWREWRKDREEHLRSLLRELTNWDAPALSWFWRGEQRDNVRTRGQLRRFASDVMEAVFPLTPRIAHDRLAERDGKDKHAQHRIPVIDTLLKPEAEMLLRQETDEAQKHVIRATLEDTGILRPIDDGWEIGRPDGESHPEAAAVWDAIREFVDAAKGSAQVVAASDLVEPFIAPPYGIPRRALSLFIGSAIAPDLRRGNLILDYARTRNSTERIREPRGEHIDNLVAAPANYTVLYVEVSDRSEAILRGVADAFDALSEEGGSLVETVASRLKEWWYGLPRHAQITAHLPDGAVAVRERIFLPLASRHGDEEEILLTVLPDLLDDEEIPIEEVRDRVRGAFVDIRDALESAAPKLAAQIQGTIVEALGGDPGENSPVDSALTTWRNTLTDGQRNNVFGGDAGQLLGLASRPDADDVASDLAEGLMGLPPEGWADDTLAEFRGHLASAKRTVEAFVPTADEGPEPPAGTVRVTVQVGGEPAFERTFAPVGEISANGENMANIIRGTIAGIGRALKDGECETILVRVIKEALNGPRDPH